MIYFTYVIILHIIICNYFSQLSNFILSYFTLSNIFVILHRKTINNEHLLGMIFKFTIISDEKDEFLRIIEIDSEASFLDLHNSILESINYDNNQMTSFFICNDDWEKEKEITLVEMESSSEYDNLVMEDTVLDELLTDEKQKLLYVFDMISDRAFFMELTEIIPGKDLDEPVCIVSEGTPPKQIEETDDLNTVIATASQKANIPTNDESFYGDENFDIEELDEEGFGDLNFEDGSLFGEDSKF